MKNITERTLGLAVLLTLLIKVILAVMIPITGDEAYHIMWGKHLAGGYYDHPPMIGWLMHLVLYLGRSELIVRLPAILFTILIGIGIYLLLKDYDKPKALLISILFLVSPLNIFFILITNDTPLIFFSFLSCAFLYKALNTKGYTWYFLSGIFLGMAFLSKYFAALLGLAYLAYLIFSEKEKQKTLGFILLFTAFMPFAAQNLYWNYTHSWVNILFNVFNRNQGDEISFSLMNFPLFILTQIYLVTPPIFYYLIKHRGEFRQRITDCRIVIFAFALIIPLTVFTLISFKKLIGLHWVLSFYPFIYIVFYPLLTGEELHQGIKYVACFSLIHLIIITIGFPISKNYLAHSKYNHIMVLQEMPGELIGYLKQQEKDFHFATENYAESAIMEYHYGKRFSVFGKGSYHGRQDDIETDFTKLDGRNILIIVKSEPKTSKYLPFFKNIEVKEINVQQTALHFVRGYGFKYNEYREKNLSRIRKKYYNIPAWLPVSTNGGK